MLECAKIFTNTVWDDIKNDPCPIQGNLNNQPFLLWKNKFQCNLYTLILLFWKKNTIVRLSFSTLKNVQIMQFKMFFSSFKYQNALCVMNSKENDTILYT